MRIRAEDEQNNFTLLRLLLAVAVVLGHFQILAGIDDPPFPFNLADAAVDCFFVVSGFLITLSYSRTRGTWPFYIRRFFRLYPLYACVVLAQTGIMLSLLPHGPLSEPGQTARYLLANLSFANFIQPNIGNVLSGIPIRSINPSLWTLKIEMGFYLVVPLIVIGFRRSGYRSLALIFVGSAFYQAVALHMGDPRLAKQLPGQMQFFVVGMFLYFYVRDWRVPYWVSGVLAAAFLAGWSCWHPIEPGICPLLAGAFVFCVALCTPVLHMRTDMSYSVYLVHGPLIQTLLVLGLLRIQPLCLAGVIVGVLALSLVFESTVERPCNEFGRRLSKRLIVSRAAPAVPTTPKVAI